MKVSLLSASFCAVLVAQSPPPPAIGPDTVVLRAGDFTLTAAQFNEIVDGLDPSMQQYVRTTGRRDFAQKIVELHFLAVEGEKRGFDKDPAIRFQIDFQTDKMMAKSMFKRLQETAQVPDSEVQSYYDAHKSEYEVLTGRHILIRVKGSPLAARPGSPELSDEEAKAKAESIRKRLVAGEDFAKLAKTESDDVSSGTKGGELGDIPRGKMVAQFEQSAFALKPGDISEPVRSQYGYHIIQVHTHTTKPLAAVKDAIVTQLKPEMARRASKAIVDKDKATLDEAFFAR